MPAVHPSANKRITKRSLYDKFIAGSGEPVFEANRDYLEDALSLVRRFPVARLFGGHDRVRGLRALQEVAYALVRLQQRENLLVQLHFVPASPGEKMVALRAGRQGLGLVENFYKSVCVGHIVREGDCLQPVMRLLEPNPLKNAVYEMGLRFLCTSRNSQARANPHSRSAVASEMPSSLPASSCVNPAKKQSFTISAARVSTFASHHVRRKPAESLINERKQFVRSSRVTTFDRLKDMGGITHADPNSSS